MERREASWPGEDPRQRREKTWDHDAPRQRRRPRWREFREAYPRIVTTMAIGLAVLLALDAWLLVERLRYQGQIRAYRRDMSAIERRRADAILESGENRTVLMVELLRRQAVGDPSLNLAVSLKDGVMRLQSQGAQLREMKVSVGSETTVGEPPDGVRLAAPQGKRSVRRVLRGAYRWEVPAWVFTQRGLDPPASRMVAEALGRVAVVLSGGTVIYSTPAAGPLAAEDWVMPGSVRARAEDLEAVADSLSEGTPVYFY